MVVKRGRDRRRVIVKGESVKIPRIPAGVVAAAVVATVIARGGGNRKRGGNDRGRSLSDRRSRSVGTLASRKSAPSGAGVARGGAYAVRPGAGAGSRGYA